MNYSFGSVRGLSLSTGDDGEKEVVASSERGGKRGENDSYRHAES